jgi:hypothetical protein
VKKMTAEDRQTFAMVARGDVAVNEALLREWIVMAAEHIAALEAEVAQAREKALEEAATYCDDRAQAAMDACRETRSAKVHASLGRIAERMHDAGEGIRALKSKPAQQAKPASVGFHDHCTFGNCWCAKGRELLVRQGRARARRNGL